MESKFLSRRRLLHCAVAGIVSVAGIGCFLQAYKRNALDIVKYPDSLLRKVSEPIRDIDQRTIDLSQQMIDTLRHKTLLDIFASGSLPRGLAAPQVGVLKRLIVCGVHGDIKVFVNPQIIEKRGEYLSREGCLSLPEHQRTIVQRSNFLEVQYRSLDNREKVIEVKGRYAASMAHEIDHINGVLYIDLPEVEV